VNKFQEELAGVLAGSLVATVGAAIFVALAGGILSSMFATSALDAVGLAKHSGLSVMVFYLIALPVIHAAGTHGPSTRLIAGMALAIGLPFVLREVHVAGDDTALLKTLLLIGVGVTLATALGSWRRYVVAEAFGLLSAIVIAAQSRGDSEANVVVVLGVLVLGPIIALGTGVLHAVEVWLSEDARAPAIALDAGGELARPSVPGGSLAPKPEASLASTVGRRGASSGIQARCSRCGEMFPGTEIVFTDHDRFCKTCATKEGVAFE
jgi:hypothetical protein